MDKEMVEATIVSVVTLAETSLAIGIDPIEIALRAFEVGLELGHEIGHLCEEERSVEVSLN